MRVKGATLRSYINVIQRHPRRDQIVAKLPPASAPLMNDPPLSGSWVDWRHIEALTVAVEAVDGMAGVRQLADDAIIEAKRPYMRVLEGVIRLFGTSPRTIFKRMNELVKSAVENMHYVWTPLSDHAGVMEIEYGTDHEVPLCMLVGARASFLAVLHACGVNGLVSEPERLAPNKASFRISW
jgi:hypothetical protein